MNTIIGGMCKHLGGACPCLLLVLLVALAFFVVAGGGYQWHQAPIPSKWWCSLSSRWESSSFQVFSAHAWSPNPSQASPKGALQRKGVAEAITEREEHTCQIVPASVADGLQQAKMAARRVAERAEEVSSLLLSATPPDVNGLEAAVALQGCTLLDEWCIAVVRAMRMDCCSCRHHERILRCLRRRAVPKGCPLSSSITSNAHKKNCRQPV